MTQPDVDAALRIDTDAKRRYARAPDYLVNYALTTVDKLCDAIDSLRADRDAQRERADAAEELVGQLARDGADTEADRDAKQRTLDAVVARASERVEEALARSAVLGRETNAERAAILAIVRGES